MKTYFSNVKNILFSNVFILSMAMTYLFPSCGNTSAANNSIVERNIPDSLMIDSTILNKLLTDINSEKIKNIHSLLIIKNDKQILEAYFNTHNREELHYTASVTKSFASVLLGIAIDKGFFGGDIPAVLNRTVTELFPEYESIIDKDPLKKELKLKHILSMTAGFDWDEDSHPYTDSRNDCNRINHHNDPMLFLFERKLIHKPGKEFYYNGGLSLVISALIEKFTKMSVDSFAEKYLFEPLGIENYRWTNVENGLTDTNGGLHLSTIDQAKLGTLMLKKGRWNSVQIVSQEWVERSTKIQHLNHNMPDYGFQWWCGDYNSGIEQHFMFLASGHGGQKIVVLPGLDLIVVISQQVFNNPFSDVNFIGILNEYILPAVLMYCADKQLVSMSRGELKKFQGRYLTKNKSESIDIELIENGLLLRGSNGEQHHFYPTDTHSFTSKVLDFLTVQIEFELDSDGIVVTLKSDIGFMNRVFYKSQHKSTDIMQH